jgi:serine/threonine-protein kinase
MKALAFHVDRRHQTALELKQDIENYLNGIGDKTTVAMASAIIAERFQSERAKLRSLIDQQVKSVSALPTGEWDKVNIPRLPATPPSLASVSSEESGNTDSHTPGTSSIKDNPALVTSPSYTPVGPVAPGSKLPAIVASSIVVAGIVAVIVFASGGASETTGGRTAEQPAHAQQAPAPVTTEVVSEPDPTATSIELSITVTPRTAAITIDGNQVDNPFTGSFPKDDEQHEIVVSAKGYQTVERKVDFTTSRALDLALDKEKPVVIVRPQAPAPKPDPAPAPEPPTQPPASAPKPTSIMGDPGPRKTRELDGDNPYK